LGLEALTGSAFFFFATTLFEGVLSLSCDELPEDDDDDDSLVFFFLTTILLLDLDFTGACTFFFFLFPHDFSEEQLLLLLDYSFFTLLTGAFRVTTGRDLLSFSLPEEDDDDSRSLSPALTRPLPLANYFFLFTKAFLLLKTEP